MSWVFEGNPVEMIDPQYCGFVYIITNKTSNKQYIGKKTLKFKKTKIVKGKKKRFYVDSDWVTYWGSSEILKEDINVLGEDNFHREIVRFCKTKGDLNYQEAKLQMELDVLLYPDKYYNEWISVRTRRSHLITKKLLSEQKEV
jgi:hypothetical protein